MSDNRGIAAFVGAVIGIVVAALIVAAILPTVINANTTGFSTAQASLFGLVPLLVIVALVAVVLNIIGGGAGGV